MSIEQDNSERVGEIFAAFGRGDVPFIMDQLTDDVHWVAHLDPIVPWSGDYSGKGRVPAFFQALGGTVEISDHPVHQLVAQGDTVVAMGEVSFRARATSTESQSAWVYVWKLRGGKVCSYDQFNDAGLANGFR